MAQASVDLGTPFDVLHNHDLSQRLKFELEWDLPQKNRIEGLEKKYYDQVGFECEIGISNSEIRFFEVERFIYHLLHTNTLNLSVGMEKGIEETGGRKYELVSEGMKFTRTRKGRGWKFTDPVKYYGFSDTALSYYKNSDFLQDMNLHQEQFFSNFYYLGPMRTKTKRIYSWSGANPESVGDNGENAIAAILSARNSGKQMKYPNTHYKKFEEVIGEALKKMGLIEEYRIDKIENRQDYEVKVKIKGADEFVSLPDVGFGVSQVLPVIVELFYAPDNSVIFIEQPEIHLHPKAQSYLADVMLDAIHMRENGKERHIQLIIETHSEHFLRRLQRRISEKAMETSDLKAYFAESGIKNSKLEELQVDRYGNILNWPEGFFGEMEEDMYKQSINEINRRLAERDSVHEE